MIEKMNGVVVRSEVENCEERLKDIYNVDITSHTDLLSSLFD
jgi:hypothetical protein